MDLCAFRCVAAVEFQNHERCAREMRQRFILKITRNLGPSNLTLFHALSERRIPETTINGFIQSEVTESFAIMPSTAT